MGKSKRRGRPRKLNAKRRQTTRAGQGREPAILPQLLLRKALALGPANDRTDVDINDPVSVLAARGLIRLDGYSPADLIREADIYRDLTLAHIGNPNANAAHLTGLVAREGGIPIIPDFDPEKDQASFEAYIYRRAAIKRRIGIPAYWEDFYPLIVSRAFPSWFPAVLDGKSPPGLLVALNGLAALVDLRMGGRHQR